MSTATLDDTTTQLVEGYAFGQAVVPIVIREETRTLDQLLGLIEAEHSNEVTEKNGIRYYIPENEHISEYHVARIGSLDPWHTIRDMVIHDLGGTYQITIFENGQFLENLLFRDKDSAWIEFNERRDHLIRQEMERVGLAPDYLKPSPDMRSLVTVNGCTIAEFYRTNWIGEKGPGAYAWVIGIGIEPEEVRVLEDDNLFLPTFNDLIESARIEGPAGLRQRIEKPPKHHEFVGGKKTINLRKR